MGTQTENAGGPTPPANDTKTAAATPEKAKPGKRVRVLVETLGPRGFVKDQITDDPKLVAMLKTKRGRQLVEEVK